MKNIARHLSSFIAPVVMCFVLPCLIIRSEHQSIIRAVTAPSTGVTIIGLVLLVKTIRLFILIGNGTIMRWDPTRKLIVVGVYRHVRNPRLKPWDPS